jgi:autotransporter-associated beta strand protein
MILTNSSAAKVGGTNVTAIASATAAFRQFMCYAATTISQAITGAIGLIKNGAGKLTLSGTCNYTGQTQINSGTLEVTGASTLNGVISGAGTLAKSGSLALTIGGNNTYSGGTNYSSSAAAATITFSSGNVFGTGNVTCSGPCQIITSATVTVPNNFILSSGTMQYRTAGAQTYTISGNISGAGNVNKTGNGTVVLSGALTYTGSTTITAGNLRAFKTTGASTATGTFNNNGTTTVLSVSFNVSPPSGVTTFRFFQGSTAGTWTIGTLTGVPVGTTATYASATSTLSVTVP